MTDIKTLTVNTDKERKDWIDLLELAVKYHNDMATELKPEVIGADETLFKFHAGIGRAILEAIWLVEMWEVEEDADPYAKVVSNVSKSKELDKQREEFMEKLNESTTDSND